MKLIMEEPKIMMLESSLYRWSMGENTGTKAVFYSFTTFFLDLTGCEKSKGPSEKHRIFVIFPLTKDKRNQCCNSRKITSSPRPSRSSKT